MWNASRFCVSSLRRGHANLLCIVPILVYVLPKQVQQVRRVFEFINKRDGTYHAITQPIFESLFLRVAVTIPQ
jgi:hypothetical protein